MYSSRRPEGQRPSFNTNMDAYVVSPSINYMENMISKAALVSPFNFSGINSSHGQQFVDGPDGWQYAIMELSYAAGLPTLAYRTVVPGETSVAIFSTAGSGTSYTIRYSTTSTNIAFFNSYSSPSATVIGCMYWYV